MEAVTPYRAFLHLIYPDANENGSDIIKIIFAIILPSSNAFLERGCNAGLPHRHSAHDPQFPPAGVFLERGCNADFLISILLTLERGRNNILISTLLTMLGYIFAIIQPPVRCPSSNATQRLRPERSSASCSRS